MPLPNNPDAKWPPPSWSDQVQYWREWDAWYAGDPSRLAQVYAPQEYAPGTVTRRGSWWRRWWNSKSAASGRELVQQRAQLHVPLPGDIAATSAALLFGEAPRIAIPEAHLPNAPADAKAAEDYLFRLVV